VLAVVHTHQATATLMGVIEAPILPILHIPATFIGEEIPIWPVPLLVTTPSRGQELAATLGDHAYCHLQGHGIISVADSVEKATVGAVILEQLAEANLRVLQTGRSPRVISPDEIVDLRAEAAPIAGRWAYYRQQVEEHAAG
jgi:ribulose-5-phosphate 4-epimerase/fuculose-1-phosphate aldolase